MTGDGKNITEAQLQIEKLKKLKVDKDSKAHRAKREEYSFDKTIEKEEKQDEIKPAETPMKTAVMPHSEKHPKAVSARFIRTIRVEKYNFDGLHRMVNEINKKRPGTKITKDKLVNMLLKNFLEAHPDFGDLGCKESIEEIMKGFKFK